MTRILLGEDHRAFGESLAHLLEREPGIRLVRRAHSAAECRRYLYGGEDFEVAIVDLYLPDGEGIGLLDEMREALPGMRSLLLTVSLDPRDHARAAEAGAVEVVSKSEGQRGIIAAVRRLADRRTPSGEGRRSGSRSAPEARRGPGQVATSAGRDRQPA